MRKYKGVRRGRMFLSIEQWEDIIKPAKPEPLVGVHAGRALRAALQIPASCEVNYVFYMDLGVYVYVERHRSLPWVSVSGSDRYPTIDMYHFILNGRAPTLAFAEGA